MKNLEEINNEVPIVKLTVELYGEYYGYLKLFPKKDQYALGKRCEDYIVYFLENILVAVELPKEQKLKFLNLASIKFNLLKTLFSLIWKLKILNNNQYISVQSKTQEIGKMLGGWIRSLKTTA